MGYADVLDYNESNKPREFQIELNPVIGSHDILETLAHEMVHVKQTVRGQLSSRGVSLFWRGKKVLCSKINYYDRPWEIEAWSKQTLLSNKI